MKKIAIEVRNNEIFCEVNGIGNLLGYKNFRRNVQDRKCRYKESYMVVENNFVSEDVVMKFAGIRLKSSKRADYIENIARIVEEIEAAKRQPEMREIMGYANYFVSEEGKVFHKENGEFVELNKELNNSGYFEVELSNGYSSRCYPIHRLIANAFCKNFLSREDRPEVHHRNSDKSDNRPSNLVWLSHEEHRELHRQKLVEAGRWDLVKKFY